MNSKTITPRYGPNYVAQPETPVDLDAEILRIAKNLDEAAVFRDADRLILAAARRIGYDSDTAALRESAAILRCHVAASRELKRKAQAQATD